MKVQSGTLTVASMVKNFPRIRRVYGHGFGCSGAEVYVNEGEEVAVHKCSVNDKATSMNILSNHRLNRTINHTLLQTYQTIAQRSILLTLEP